MNKNQDYKTLFSAKVNELLSSDINSRISALSSEIKRLYAEQKLNKRRKNYDIVNRISDELDIKTEQVSKLCREKCQAADELIEWYIDKTGERPISFELYRLARWIEKGAEILSEHYALSDRQMANRRKRELPDALIDEKVFADDGNSWREPKPRMDGDGSHFEYVRFPSDGEDKRRFNGNLRKYNVNTGAIWRKNSD